jgi:CpeT protein
MSELQTFAQWMAGGFSNGKQAMDAPRDFSHIRLFWRPLPWEFFGGVGFYSEQVYDYDLWLPYRQGVHHLVEQPDGSIFVHNYGLKNAIFLAGAGRELSILKTLKRDVLLPRSGCGMVFRRDGAKFVGAVEPGNQCLIPKEGKMTYLVSEVEVTDSTWTSRDRGFDVDTQDQVWGSEHGQFWFEKVQDYGSELASELFSQMAAEVA